MLNTNKSLTTATNLKKIKVARIATVPEAFVSLTQNIQDYINAGFEVDLICSQGDYSEKLTKDFKFNVVHCEIPRNISLVKDMRSVFSLAKILWRNNYDIIHSNTPKAGLVTALSGLLSFRKIRLHTFTGQRWVTTKNPLRLILKFIDLIVIKLNTRCYADSPSQIQFLIDEKVAKPGEIFCLGEGSFGGINFSKFNMTDRERCYVDLRKKLAIPENSICCLFVGRIVKDKGINELISVFKNMSEFKNLHLVLVGPEEKNLDPISPESSEEIAKNPRIHALGFQTDVAYYMKASDFLCLPSYREGFGSVVIEAAACGIPAIGTNIAGLKDAIIHNETGLLISLDKLQDLKNSIAKLSTDHSFRNQLGQKAFDRAQKHFNHQILSDLQIKDYKHFYDLNN